MNTRFLRGMCCRIRAAAAPIALFSSVLFSYTPGYAQTGFQTTFEFPDDVKHFSTTRIKPSANYTSPTDESLLAGTIFRNVGSDGAADGSVTVQVTDGDAFMFGGWEYNHPDYDDERAVAIVSDNSSNPYYYVISMVRPDPAGGLAVKNRDMIKILRMDDGKSTASLREATIYENTSITSTAHVNSMYPTHALFHVNGGKRLIYICGYFTSTDTRNSTHLQPDFVDEKEAFVVSFDIDTWQIDNAIFLNWDPTLYTKPDNKDYDIALRMMVTNAGKIWVTGSTNALTGGMFPAYVPLRSATMNIVLEPDLSANAAPVIYDNPFVWLGNGDGYGGNEYGMSFHEDAGNPGTYYIAGNFFDESMGGPPMYGNIGFNAWPFWWYITRLGATYNFIDRVIPGDYYPNLQVNSNAYVSTILPSDGTAGANQTRFLLTGMIGNYVSCYTTPFQDGAPFIYDLLLDFNAGPLDIVNGSSNFQNYLTAAGIGYPNNNSYGQLGGGLSNIMWHPVIFRRENATNSNMMFTGPREINGKLGIKAFEGDGGGTPKYDTRPNGSCPTPDNSCGLPDIPMQIQSPMCTLQRRKPTLKSVEDTPTPDIYMSLYFPVSNEDCSVQYKNGTTSIPKFAKPSTTIISPNPASTVITIKPGKEIADDSKTVVTLSNMQGQVVKELFTGTAAGLHYATLKLPEVATGLYIVQVYSNGTMVHQQKLSIQQ